VAKSKPSKKSVSKSAAKKVGKVSAKPAAKPAAKPPAKAASSKASASKPPASKAAASKAAASKAPASKAPASKASVSKGSAAKAVAAKPAPAKPAAGKPVTEKVVAKPAAKASGKVAMSASTSAGASAATSAGAKAAAQVASKSGLKAGAKAGATAVENPAEKLGEVVKPAALAVPVVDDKNKPKGITVIDNKPGSGRKPPKPKKVVEMPQLGPPLLSAGKKWKPLIVSGPNAPKAAAKDVNPESLKGKSPLSKKELDHYRGLLLKKRGELVGDVSTMESAALHDASGNLSNTPQHVAEQGSEAYEQSLSLGIAEVDRQLIREIDEALRRIADSSYGLCQRTGKPISKERLDELPWTRLSIEAAREYEKRTFFPRGSSSESSRVGGSSSSGD